jgi:predicted GH43/DUF377 family glycosyl hydrolase
MYKPAFLVLLASCILQYSSAQRPRKYTSDGFAKALVEFTPYKNNPVFAGTGANTWDKNIRERGYILHEDSLYHLWYTGYTDTSEIKHLGYATSTDGLNWTRYKDNPVYSDGWVEDMCVVKSAGVYYMFAEGRGDTAHMLTSTDRIHWTEEGNLDIRRKDGTPISKGPFGTPAVMKEKELWYLFYERDDLGIWLATSADGKLWTNVQDEPVLKMGPESYDRFAVAVNQVIQYDGLYYAYYHASAFKDWQEWSTNVAVSKDLVHWKKYAKNPIVGNDKSSGIMVNSGKAYRLYTMHPQVNVYFPAGNHVR